MEAIEAFAIIILVIAIIILIYYYLLNSPETAQKLRNFVPSTADAHMDEVLGKNSDYDDLSKEKISVEEESGSMSERIKVKLSDIDMSGLKSDAFSNKIDAFLDAKSDELIKDWSLATTDDLKELESKFGETTSQVDTLEKSFDEFKKSSEEFQKATEEKLADLDERIDALENK